MELISAEIIGSQETVNVSFRGDMNFDFKRESIKY